MFPENKRVLEKIMKQKLKNYLWIILPLLAFGFSACNDDEYTTEGKLVGRYWAGNIGFLSDDPRPERLESEFFFGADGFGTEQQFYQSDYAPYGKTLKFRWEWDYRGNRNIILDYGRQEPAKVLVNVQIYDWELRAIFYNDYYDYEHNIPTGYPIRLSMIN